MYSACFWGDLSVHYLYSLYYIFFDWHESDRKTSGTHQELSFLFPFCSLAEAWEYSWSSVPAHPACMVRNRDIARSFQDQQRVREYHIYVAYYPFRTPPRLYLCTEQWLTWAIPIESLYSLSWRVPIDLSVALPSGNIFWEFLCQYVLDNWVFPWWDREESIHSITSFSFCHFFLHFPYILYNTRASTFIYLSSLHEFPDHDGDEQHFLLWLRNQPKW